MPRASEFFLEHETQNTFFTWQEHAVELSCDQHGTHVMQRVWNSGCLSQKVYHDVESKEHKVLVARSTIFIHTYILIMYLLNSYL